MRRFAAALVLLSCHIAEGNKGWRRVLEEAGVRDERIFRAMEKVRRADFLPEDQKRFEFEDRPLPIGHSQTTSQPSLIALMVEAMELKPGCRVLEVGTGSGYQTALLAELCRDVYSVEILEPLARRAKERLERLGHRNAHVKASDGYLGWPEKAPFDGIVVGAAAPNVPPPLVEQLAVGGRLVIPVDGPDGTYLWVVRKEDKGRTAVKKTLPVRFVPLTGEHADRDRGAR